MRRFWISVVFAIGSLWAGMVQADVTMAIPNVTGDPAADIRFRVVYPDGWEPVPTAEKGVVLALGRGDANLSEMLMLRVEKMTEEEAAWVFAEKGGMTPEARLSLAQRVIGVAREVKVLSLEDIRIAGQPAVLITMEEQVKNAAGTFFHKEMIQVVWAWGRKITQNYLVTGQVENRVAVVKRFARGERDDPGTFMGSLHFLNKARMEKAAP
ncbi:hypothetical protein NB640_10440 [Oxalobacter vibrioformis]|uniref:Chalcone isomerase domain-containing protein n=1 Tax=Oxalobacter vibrioformis TaxID=933080 RepID=A0A9E9LXZ8_9BURK|nr:hypothetical protein [Oxalobacter vibrioformis]WAW09640.1 hypothetical protein NB640_10440 [Oxalobacter vibrioformis]